MDDSDVSDESEDEVTIPRYRNKAYFNTVSQ